MLAINPNGQVPVPIDDDLEIYDSTLHRLLKNQVSRENNYALFTRPALEHMDVDPNKLGLQPHTESYEHFGEVECFFGRAEV